MITRTLNVEKPMTERPTSLKRVFDDDGDFKTYKTMLYIGAKGAGGRHVKMFSNFDVTFLEVWEPNVKVLRSFSHKVIHADIRDYVDSGDVYDVVMWWHGPEHVPAEELPGILEKLKKLTRGLVITGCPCGDCPQGIVRGNPYEIHLSSSQPQLFTEAGYNTETLLFSDGRDGNQTNITAWYKKNPKKEAPPEYYDDVFAVIGRYEGGRKFYYKWAVRVLRDNQQSEFQGLDVGCGPGGFLQEASEAKLYVDGIDFSSEAVKQASVRTPNKVITSTFKDFTGWGDYQYFSILETLEHVEDDIALLQKLPSGSFVVGCVPSFGGPSHLRCFPRGSVDIISRYKGLFEEIHTETLKNEKLFGFYGRLK